jgi:hypothetical protein
MITKTGATHPHRRHRSCVLDAGVDIPWHLQRRRLPQASYQHGSSPPSDTTDATPPRVFAFTNSVCRDEGCAVNVT